jgi:hypothetical protein
LLFKALLAANNGTATLSSDLLTVVVKEYKIGNILTPSLSR